jgi:cytochrome c biogenesis protein CcdA
MRRAARWYVAVRAVAFAFGVVFSLVVCVACARGYYNKVTREIRGVMGR